MELASAGQRPAVVAAEMQQGWQSVELEAGKSFKIETNPGGVELLNATVPAGKHWTVAVQVTVIETDA